MIVREMLRDVSVLCDRAEPEEALAWARQQPGWADEHPALRAQGPHGELS